jgi:uncharacterized SAM-binding protein YcdF (DUF218 family)
LELEKAGIECAPRKSWSFMLWGMLNRKERWGLSWRGWLSLLGLGALALSLLFFRAYPFLAVTERVKSEVLVVEGWVRAYTVRAAVAEWKSGHYPRIYSTGGPVSGLGGYVNDFQTSASVGADLLKRTGVPVEAVQMVPSRVVDRDRTYGSAVALREWFREHGIQVTCLNVVTEDVHARRTRMLYQRAFGDKVVVGVIAVPNPDYDASHWWRYSEGMKDLMSEGGAYLYAKLFFHPKNS